MKSLLPIWILGMKIGVLVLIKLELPWGQQTMVKELRAKDYEKVW